MWPDGHAGQPFFQGLMVKMAASPYLMGAGRYQKQSMRRLLQPVTSACSILLNSMSACAAL